MVVAVYKINNSFSSLVQQTRGRNGTNSRSLGKYEIVFKTIQKFFGTNTFSLQYNRKNKNELIARKIPAAVIHQNRTNFFSQNFQYKFVQIWKFKLFLTVQPFSNQFFSNFYTDLSFDSGKLKTSGIFCFFNSVLAVYSFFRLFKLINKSSGFLRQHS